MTNACTYGIKIATRLKKKRLKVTQLEKVSFIKVIELKLTHSYFGFFTLSVLLQIHPHRFV